MRFAMILALTAMPAGAVQYTGNPVLDCCAYMVGYPEDGVHWDGNDPSPWNTCAYVEGSSTQSFALVTWECDEPWLSVSFGNDTLAGAAWKRKLFIESDGVENTAHCYVYYDGALWMEWDIYEE